jgi:hypothetical protein
MTGLPCCGFEMSGDEQDGRMCRKRRRQSGAAASSHPVGAQPPVPKNQKAFRLCMVILPFSGQFLPFFYVFDATVGEPVMVSRMLRCPLPQR